MFEPDDTKLHGLLGVSKTLPRIDRARIVGGKLRLEGHLVGATIHEHLGHAGRQQRTTRARPGRREDVLDNSPDARERGKIAERQVHVVDLNDGDFRAGETIVLTVTNEHGTTSQSVRVEASDAPAITGPKEGHSP